MRKCCALLLKVNPVLTESVEVKQTMVTMWFKAVSPLCTSAAQCSGLVWEVTYPKTLDSPGI